jgi:hypothetical protein
MNNLYRLKFLFIIILIVILFLAVGFLKLPFVRAASPENVWVSTNNTIAEYTQTGTLVTSSIAVPNGGGDTPARDLIVGANGLIHLFNGTFDPHLSTYYPITTTWTHQTYSEWSTVNNVSYGGIARHQHLIFVTDMNTFGDAAMGIVQFDTATGTPQRFADTLEFIDLTMGLDRLLYALEGDENTVRVYNPSTQALVRTINLAKNVRGIAVNGQGYIFGASWDGNIYHFDANGAQLNSKANATINLTDIDIACDGQIVAGSNSGEVIFSDESLAAVTSFSTGSDSTFVAFSNPRTSCVYLPVVIR